MSFLVEECTASRTLHVRFTRTIQDKDRLAFEKEWDGISQMRLWILAEGYATEEELDLIEKNAKKEVRASIKQAWLDFNIPIKQLRDELIQVLAPTEQISNDFPIVNEVVNQLKTALDPTHKDIIKQARSARRRLDKNSYPEYTSLVSWIDEKVDSYKELYHSHLYSQTPKSASKVEEVKPLFKDDAPSVNGYEVLNACFDYHLQNDPSIYAFGEDVGYIGDVNQGFVGMQETW